MLNKSQRKIIEKLSKAYREYDAYQSIIIDEPNHPYIRSFKKENEKFKLEAEKLEEIIREEKYFNKI